MINNFVINYFVCLLELLPTFLMEKKLQSETDWNETVLNIWSVSKKVKKTEHIESFLCMKLPNASCFIMTTYAFAFKSP